MATSRHQLSLDLAPTIALVFICLSIIPAGALIARAADDVIPLDRPFTFAYLNWENKARIDGGIVRLDAAGMTPKGGAGVNASLDFSGHQEDCLALTVQVGPGNTLHVLRLLLRDTAGHTGIWSFPLPAASKEPARVTPLEGASLARPNEPGKDGPLDLGKIMQWQLMGDWNGDGAINVRVTAIALAKPDESIRQARAENAKHDQAARVEAEQRRAAARQKYAVLGPDSPVIEAVYAAAPDVLALQVREGRLTPSKLADYQPKPGDHMNQDHHLIRDGQDVGWLIGPPGKEDGLVSGEGFSGDPLLLDDATDPENYRVSSSDDSAFSQPARPTAVYQKSKADDWQQFTRPGIVVLHRLYLKLPRPLTAGRSYQIALQHINTTKPRVTFVFDPSRAWTEVIHVNQVGFRPDDPVKRAFISLWMGTGGPLRLPAGLNFRLVDAASGKTVYQGVVGAAWPADKPEQMQNTRNFNAAEVAPIDFSDFAAPGRYRVVVDAVGCSDPFDIGPDVWQKAFWVQMKGFYNERSGVKLGPPYSDFVRPVCWKPQENGCMPITQSTYSIVDGNPNGQGNLASGDTGKPVPEAWGGYHDAGDWNPRRIDHMVTTTFYQLELLQLFPNYFKSFKLNIPNDAPGPDLLKECLFELDLFRRLQLPDGSCRFGIETDGDPFGGEVSWKQHMPGFVYAPDIYSSYLFAAGAARAAAVLEPYDAKLSAEYRQAALKAMTWAEADRARRVKSKRWDSVPMHNDDVHHARNLAAVCLYGLTRDAAWDQVFCSATELAGEALPVFRGDTLSRSAAFAYARLPEGVGDPRIKDHARRALLADADGSLAYQSRNAFGIASDDPGRPQFLGFYSTAHGAISMLRAHALTGNARYLAGAVKACLFPCGANPSNLIYTSGLGVHSVKAMNMDAIATGQPAPIGLTPYGNIDLQTWAVGDGGNWITWPITWYVGKHTTPGCFDWPTAEAYWDVRFWPSYCEFCIDQTMGINAYAWGYLAARKP